MIQMQTNLDVADNSGAKRVQNHRQEGKLPLGLLPVMTFLEHVLANEVLPVLLGHRRQARPIQFQDTRPPGDKPESRFFGLAFQGVDHVFRELLFGTQNQVLTEVGN